MPTAQLTSARWEPAEKSQYSKKDMKVIGPELARLRAAGVRLTPENIVIEARKKSSPLHSYFTWDAKEAHRQHLLSEAGRMLRSVKIIFETIVQGQPKLVAVRAYHVITEKVAVANSGGDAEATPLKNGRRYAGLDEVLANQKLLDQVIERALKELQNIKKKFQVYSVTLPGFRQRLREAATDLFACADEE